VHTETCDLCRSEIAKLQGDLASYSMMSDIVAPPPEARERFVRQVAKEPKPILPPEPVPAPVIERVAPDRGMTDHGIADRGITDRGIPDRGIPERGIQDPGTADLGLPDRRRDRPPAPAEPVFSTRQRRALQMEAADEEDHEEHRRPRRAPWVLAWTGWAVAAGCSFVAGLQFHQRQQIQNSVAAQQAKMDDITKQSARAQNVLATLTATNALQVALRSTGDVKPGVPSATALAAYMADKGALVFVATHLDPVPLGKTYELWLMPADGRNPMPAGMFKPDAQGNASVVMPQIPTGVPAKGFGVTVENEGGSDTPTLPVVLAGT
jgi:Anti-sigma-K factor rskA